MAKHLFLVSSLAIAIRAIRFHPPSRLPGRPSHPSLPSCCCSPAGRPATLLLPRRCKLERQVRAGAPPECGMRGLRSSGGEACRAVSSPSSSPLCSCSSSSQAPPPGSSRPSRRRRRCLRCLRRTFRTWRGSSTT